MTKTVLLVLCFCLCKEWIADSVTINSNRVHTYSGSQAGTYVQGWVMNKVWLCHWHYTVYRKSIFVYFRVDPAGITGIIVRCMQSKRILSYILSIHQLKAKLVRKYGGVYFHTCTCVVVPVCHLFTNCWNHVNGANKSRGNTRSNQRCKCVREANESGEIFRYM